MNIVGELGFDPGMFCLGSICKNGHQWGNTEQNLRYKRGGDCLECRIAYRKLYYEANKDKINEKGKLYNEANREKVQEHGKLYRERNKEKIREKKKREHEANRERNLARSKKHHAKNRLRYMELARRNYQKTRDQRKERDRLYAIENREEAAARKKRWYEENADRVRKRNRKTYYDNHEQRLARSRELYKTSEGKAIVLKAAFKRRARKQQNHHYPYSKQEIGLRLEQFNGQCAYCGSDDRMSWDHFIAIAKGGSDCINNLIPACKSCNCSKNDSDPFLWYQRRTYFSKKRWQAILRVLGKTQANYEQLPLL